MQVKVIDVLNKAVELHSKGNIIDAQVLYEEILNSYPDHPDANHNYSILLARKGQLIEAKASAKVALHENGTNPQYWITMAEILHRLHQGASPELSDLIEKYEDNFPNSELMLKYKS